MTLSLKQYALIIVLGCLCYPAHAQKITEAAAMTRVERLPMVRQFSQTMQQSPAHTPMTVRSEGQFTEAGRKFWSIYVGESHDTHTVLWQRFAVDVQNGAIFSIDLLTDEMQSVQ